MKAFVLKVFLLKIKINIEIMALIMPLKIIKEDQSKDSIYSN